MPRTPQVTTRAAALGAGLRAARKATPGRPSVHAVAEALGITAGSISRYENGRRKPERDVVIRLLDYYTGAGLVITEQTRNELLELAEDPETAPWVATTIPEQRRQMDTLLVFERAAVDITDVQPLLIPGLCQTPEYARAIMRRAGVASEDIEMRVAVRTGRRYTLTRENKPARYLALINETVLRRPVGGPEVMSEQLRFLLHLSKRGNVSVRVVPDETDWHQGLEGPFLLHQFTDRPPVVHLEIRGSALFLDREQDAARYVTAVEFVLREAMTESDSVQVITREAERMERMINR